MSILTPGQQIATVKAGAWDVDVSGDVLSDVVITHGRESFSTYTAAMSTARFTLRVPRGFVNYWALGQVGNTIRIETVAGRRFTGHITDLDYSWEETTEGWMLMHRVQCVGTISRLGSRLLTNSGWPWQTTTDRVRAILGAAWAWGTEAWRIEGGDYNPTKLAIAERDISKPALAELEDLIFEGEAVLYDDVDGAVAWQQLSYRNSRLAIVGLPPEAIAFAPDFAQRLDVVNTVTMEYGDADPRPVTQAQHDESRIYLGVWWERYSTDYALQVHAQVKADRIARRQGWPVTIMPSVDILLNRLTPAQLTAVAGLRVGHKVRLPRLPDPYPSDPDLPGQTSGVWIVEGWQEYVGSRFDPDDEWRLTLHLSPPIWSMVGKTWAEMAVTGERWMDFPSTTWDEIGDL